VSEIGRAANIALPVRPGPRCVPVQGTQRGGAHANEMQQACAAVEGLFLAQLLSELGRPVFGGGLLDSGATRQVFSAQQNWALGAELGRRGELGLARMLTTDLQRTTRDARMNRADR
jgi:Rod binding domain-containing protein